MQRLRKLKDRLRTSITGTWPVIALTLPLVDSADIFFHRRRNLPVCHKTTHNRTNPVLILSQRHILEEFPAFQVRSFFAGLQLRA